MGFVYVGYGERVLRTADDFETLEIWNPEEGWEPYLGDEDRVAIEGAILDGPPDGVEV